MDVGTGRRGARALLVVAAVCLVACRSAHRPPDAPADGGHAAAVPRLSRVQPLMQRLASRDQKEAGAARAELRTWKGVKAPSVAAGIELLRASTTEFRSEKPDDFGAAAEIMRVLGESPQPEYAPVIEEVF